MQSFSPWQLLIAGLLLAAAGCATPEATRSEPSADNPAAESARLAAEAPLEERRAVVDELEVRLRNVSADGLQNGDGVEAAVRVPFGNPWEMSAEAHVWEAESAVAWTDFDEADLTQRVRRCRMSADSAESQALSALQEDHQVFAAQLEQWATDLAAANGMNELAAAELKLELALERTRNRPAPAIDVAGAGMPALSRPVSPLSIDSEEAAQQVSAHGPEARRALAEAELSRARAGHADAERIPFLDFGEVSYGVGSGDGPDRLEFQLSMLIPFGVAASAAADRHEMEAQSHELAASARQAEAVEEVLPVLMKLRDFEAEIPELQELETVSADAARVAEAWLDDRLGEPEQVARTFEAILRARKTVVERRADAARSGCDLLELTGVPVADWPRE